MSREGEVLQPTCYDKFNLAMGQTENSKPFKTNVNKVYNKIYNLENLANAYEKISVKKAANTPSIDLETLDGFSKSKLKEISAKLKDHSYMFKPLKRAYIPKNKGEERAIGIPNPTDKVVLKSAVLVLQEIYEKKFLDCSHGYRPNRSVHTALKKVTG